jgi:hypothetical protein
MVTFTHNGVLLTRRQYLYCTLGLYINMLAGPGERPVVRTRLESLFNATFLPTGKYVAQPSGGSGSLEDVDMGPGASAAGAGAVASSASATLVRQTSEAAAKPRGLGDSDAAVVPRPGTEGKRARPQLTELMRRAISRQKLEDKKQTERAERLQMEISTRLRHVDARAAAGAGGGKEARQGG